jgi:hypothetical protein
MTEALRKTTNRSVLCLLCLLAAPALDAQVRVLDLREMTGAAGSIFIGTVASVHGGTDEHGDIVTYTAFNVEDAIYGVPGNGIAIKQLGGETPALSMRLEHMRYFRKGERVLVMLYPTSSLGFTSPIGLSQGVWTIGDDGRVGAVSDDALRGLDAMLRGYGIRTKETQSVDRAVFVGIIKQLLREEGKR